MSDLFWLLFWVVVFACVMTYFSPKWPAPR